MASSEIVDEAGCVEMIAETVMGKSVEQDEEITPLLEIKKPKMNIFSVSYPRRIPKELSRKEADTEFSTFNQFILWIWRESRYSGLLCVVFSSMIYSIMEALLDIFPVRPIPLSEIMFTRCTIILISSFVWLRRTGQPVFGPPHIRSFLIARALVGYLSLLSFIYSIRALPLCDAIILNFTTPITATVAARVILNEKLSLINIGGLACSFLGALFIFQPILFAHGGLPETNASSDTHIIGGSHRFYAVLIGLFSSITGGISYCLIRGGAKASDQLVVTVFVFGVLASPATLLITFAFQEFVIPDFYSSLSMAILGVLAFFAEVFIARGLQLEKTSKVANILYTEAVMSQALGILLSRLVPSLLRLVGCMLIMVSVSCTVYLGREKGPQ